LKSGTKIELINHSCIFLHIDQIDS